MTDRSDIVVLQTTALPEPAVDFLDARFRLIRMPDDESGRRALLAEHGTRIRAIAGGGKGKVDAALFAALPNLEIISILSAGLDAIDTAEAARRRIPIFNTSQVLSDDVADLALWLVLGTARRLAAADRFVRDGDWMQTGFPLGKTMRGMKIGIVGLGHIGKAIARRLEVLGAVIGYHGRTEQPGSGYRYFADLGALAAWSETLVIACPITPETFHMVDARILDALGPDGIVVNIARGAIIHEAALAAAIAAGRLYGAGLDVFEHEPAVTEALVESDRTIVLPHVGSATTGTRQRMWQSMIEALLAHFNLPPAPWSR